MFKHAKVVIHLKLQYNQSFLKFKSNISYTYLCTSNKGLI